MPGTRGRHTLRTGRRGRSKAFSGVCGIGGDRRHEGHGHRRGTVSAVPLEDAIERADAPERNAKLPPKALAYCLCVAAAAVGVTAPFLAELDRHTGNWFEFAVLASCVAVAQFFVVTPPGNKSYHTTGVFLIAAVLLLPPELLAPIAVVQHVPEWLRSRMSWYVQSFNIFTYTFATMSAWAAAEGVLRLHMVAPSGNAR